MRNTGDRMNSHNSSHVNELEQHDEKEKIESERDTSNSVKTRFNDEKHASTECWKKCGYKGGICSSGFCGQDSGCCRKGLALDSPECKDSKTPCDGHHYCVKLKPSKFAISF